MLCCFDWVTTLYAFIPHLHHPRQENQLLSGIKLVWIQLSETQTTSYISTIIMRILFLYKWEGLWVKPGFKSLFYELFCDYNSRHSLCTRSTYKRVNTVFKKNFVKLIQFLKSYQLVKASKIPIKRSVKLKRITKVVRFRHKISYERHSESNASYKPFSLSLLFVLPMNSFLTFLLSLFDNIHLQYSDNL